MSFASRGRLFIFRLPLFFWAFRAFQVYTELKHFVELRSFFISYVIERKDEVVYVAISNDIFLFVLANETLNRMLYTQVNESES